MNKKIIITIILILILIILVIIFIPKWKGKNIDMNEIKENIKNKDTSFDFDNRYVTLNNGIKMPIIGLGTWTFTNEEAEDAVYIAIKNGYRLIDTAQYYGDEVGVGKGVRKAIDEGIVKREDIFVTSKIYASTDHNKAIEKSLNNLELDYIDLLLIHQPGFDDKGLYQTMEKYYKEGKLKTIGISNYYTKEAIDEVLSYAEIVPAVIQNENHIYYQNNELQEYVKQYGIIIESWYPFGGRGHTDENFNNETIVKIAKKYNKTSAQIILRWQLQAGYIAIPGSKNPDHIKENISIFDFELSDEDMKKIYNINENRRYENW
jgi:diketogulonate reductase-like aldo/keto reductase